MGGSSFTFEPPPFISYKVHSSRLTAVSHVCDRSRLCVCLRSAMRVTAVTHQKDREQIYRNQDIDWFSGQLTRYKVSVVRVKAVYSHR